VCTNCSGKKKVWVEAGAGPPWRVALLSENPELGRELARALAHPEFRFTVTSVEGINRYPGGSATFDLVLLYVGREPVGGDLPRELLRRFQGCVVVLAHAPTEMERAWWIANGADDCLSEPCDNYHLLLRLRASILRRRRGFWL
jgi:DNA-binding response OmpR family regulator